uniref:HTH La-type RNA-binding domain-containing protein n=1 Tax=Panagrellus redivivus TaxID=6233 RepID=A0A7E4W3P5_PANRE
MLPLEISTFVHPHLHQKMPPRRSPSFPAVSTWIEAFAEAECASLKEFYVYNALPSIIEIDKDVFLKFFFKAQPDDFLINFSISEKTEPDSISDGLKHLFDEHFEYAEIDHSIEKNSVFIRLRNNPYTLRDG